MSTLKRENVLIVVSGDLIAKKRKALSFIKECGEKYFGVSLIGGGTHITAALKKAYPNYKPKFIPLLGRVLKDSELRMIASDTLKRNQENFQNLCVDEKINVETEIPVWELGKVTCHMNTDLAGIIFSINFHQVFICTVKGRGEKKRKILEKINRLLKEINEMEEEPEEFEGINNITIKEF